MTEWTLLVIDHGRGVSAQAICSEPRYEAARPGNTGGIGGLLALATFGAAVRRKGLLGGTANTVLDFIPWVGGAKNLVEAARGHDFIRDKPASR